MCTCMCVILISHIGFHVLWVLIRNNDYRGTTLIPANDDNDVDNDITKLVNILVCLQL